MSTLYTINVRSEMATAQDFFFFQAPAVYSGGATVYSNSIYSSTLAPSSQGAQLTFEFNQQYYAGVETANAASTPAIGQASGSTIAVQPIDLAPAAGGAATNDWVSMNVDPLGLTPPTSNAGVIAGNYMITTPTFNSTAYQYNAGLAVQSKNGGYVLSNYINALPNQDIQCQPVVNFYVTTGSYTAGTVINFTTASTNSALCDASTGFLTFDVVYTANGTWIVTPSA